MSHLRRVTCLSPHHPQPPPPDHRPPAACRPNQAIGPARSCPSIHPYQSSTCPRLPHPASTSTLTDRHPGCRHPTLRWCQRQRRVVRHRRTPARLSRVWRGCRAASWRFHGSRRVFSCFTCPRVCLLRFVVCCRNLFFGRPTPPRDGSDVRITP